MATCDVIMGHDDADIFKSPPPPVRKKPSDSDDDYQQSPRGKRPRTDKKTRTNGIVIWLTYSNPSANPASSSPPLRYTHHSRKTRNQRVECTQDSKTGWEYSKFDRLKRIHDLVGITT